MKTLRLSAAAALVLIMAAPVHAKTIHNWRFDQCRYRMVQPAHPPAFTVQEVKQTIWCAVQHWPVAGGYQKALSVAECESSLATYAVSPSGSYVGVYQMGQSEFDHNVGPASWHLIHNRLNGRANVIAAIRMAHSYGWGPWACA